MRRVSVDLMLAIRGVLRMRHRTLLAGTGICGGVVAMMLAAGFVEWNFWNYRESTIASQLGHLRVHRSGFGQSGQANPHAFLLPESSTELQEIRALPAVKTVGPRLFFSGLIGLGDTTTSFVGEGVDPEKERLLSRGLDIRDGAGLSETDAKGILIGEGLAANLGARVGDKITLVASMKSGGVNAIECTVRGLFSTISKAYDDVAIRVPIVAAQELLRVKGAHAWVVLLNKTEDTDDVLRVLREKYVSGGLEFSHWLDSSDFYRKSRELYAKQVFVINMIIATIIVLSISNSQMMSVAERTSEVGTSMALGARRLTVLRRFLLEGLVLGITGTLVGLAVGYALAGLISWIGIPLPPAPGMARGYQGEIMITTWIAADAAVLAIVTTCVASVYPAWRASRMVIVDALRFSR